jgi:hypothetical protein
MFRLLKRDALMVMSTYIVIYANLTSYSVSNPDASRSLSAEAELSQCAVSRTIVLPQDYPLQRRIAIEGPAIPYIAITGSFLVLADHQSNKLVSRFSDGLSRLLVSESKLHTSQAHCHNNNQTCFGSSVYTKLLALGFERRRGPQ